MEKFIAHRGIYPIGSLVRLENSLLAVVVARSEECLLYPIVRVVYDTMNAKRLMPFEIDLGRQHRAGNACAIVNCESGEKWQIRPVDYLLGNSPARRVWDN